MIRKLRELFTSTFAILSRSNVSRMSAAMTYFTMLSLSPLLIIAIAIAGLFFGGESAQIEIVEQVENYTSPAIAETVAGLISNASRPSSGIFAGTLSILILGFAASGVFSQLQDTFDDIWDVPAEKRSGLKHTAQQRLIGIVMVLVVGIVLLLALIMNASIARLTAWLTENYPRGVSWLLWADRGISYLLLPSILAITFRYVPHRRIRWLDVVPAAFLTSLLIGASRYLIDLYLQFSTTSEVYGAAGSLVVLLVWIYITGMILFLGAAFSRAWAETFGSLAANPRIRPMKMKSE